MQKLLVHVEVHLLARRAIHAVEPSVRDGGIQRVPIRGERASEYARVERPVRVRVVVLSDGLIPLRRVPHTTYSILSVHNLVN